MANKKITVLGDIGDPSLTPDETHKIEVRIDKMMAINEPESAPEPPAEQPHEAKVIEPLHQDLAVDEPAPVVEEEPVAPVPKPKTKIPITMVDDESEAMPPSAPPLVKMPKPAKKVSIVQDTVEDKETELLAPSELPDTPLQIDIGAPELTIVPSAEENENDEPLDEPLADEAPLDNQEPLAPKPDDGEKKYRPPDGPLPFKRAEPAETEDASQNATPTLNAQQAEDEAITKAFAAQDAARHKKPRSKAKLRRASKVGLVLVALLLVAGAAAFAVPSVRHKLIGMNDKQSSTPTTSVTPKQATAAVAATQPTGYDVYMARQDGIYNVYKIMQNGQPQLLLTGTGNEDANSVLVSNDQNTMAALVSIRDKQKDTAGYNLQRLTLIDVASGTSSTVTQAQRVYIVGWFGNRLVYVAAKTAAATTDSAAYQLMSYDTATKQAKILDQANHFNSVLNARGAIYYATSNPGGSNTVLKIMPDGTKKQVLLTKEVFSIYRTAYNDISFATATSWYRMSLSDTTPMLTTNAYSGSGLLYIDAPDGRHSARVVSNGTVYIYDTKTSKETTLTTQTGASYPMHWLSNSTFSLRVDTAKETADYAVNITDGKTTKIVDVSTIAGMQLWQ